MKWNTYHLVDCMDPDIGLPSLKSKSVDLGLTDPPYNAKYKASRTKKKKTLAYSDDMTENEYLDWCVDWFVELKRVCKGIIFTPGNKNFPMWCIIEEPEGYGFHYKSNSRSTDATHHLGLCDVYIIYGKLPHKLKRNVWDIPARLTDYLHTCPKTYKFFHDILSDLRPKTVVDPFLGSGTTAQACTQLEIKWLGYEIASKYEPDIQKRIRRGNVIQGETRLDEF